VPEEELLALFSGKVVKLVKTLSLSACLVTGSMNAMISNRTAIVT